MFDVFVLVFLSFKSNRVKKRIKRCVCLSSTILE